MIISTQRLTLRPWQDDDASSLYNQAKNPLVGPSAGWPVHTSVENSLEIIHGVLSQANTFAVTINDCAEAGAVGSMGLMVGKVSGLGIADNEAEIGYWIGQDFWGKGYIPEAVNALLKYAFDELGIETMWCGYYDGNEKSKRVQEKCGFTYHHTIKDKPCPLIGKILDEHVSCLPKARWMELISK